MVAFAAALCAQTPAEPATGPLDAAAIMAQVAANVAAAEPARRSYVYHQTVRASLTKTNGKPVRKERREYDVVPGEERTEKTLAEFEGERYDGKETALYFKPGTDDGMDSSLIREMTEELVDDKKSRDGIPHDLFPLTASDLPLYSFTLQERGEFRGRPVYKIAFDPLRKDFCVDQDTGGCDTPWKGEIWVDTEDLQPARIVTDLGAAIPWGVRVFLGTNVKQLGFSVSYERVEPGVWFPVSYGTEFRLDVLWFYKRNVTLGLESKDFRRTDATSSIDFALPQ